MGRMGLVASGNPEYIELHPKKDQPRIVCLVDWTSWLHYCNKWSQDNAFIVNEILEE